MQGVYLFPQISQQDTSSIHQKVDTVSILNSTVDHKQKDTVVKMQAKTNSSEPDNTYLLPKKGLSKSENAADFLLNEDLLSNNPFHKSFTETDNFLVDNLLSSLKTGKPNDINTSSRDSQFTISGNKFHENHLLQHSRTISTSNWMLFIFLLVMLIFIWIKFFYSKFILNLTNSLFSYQLSAKSFREKNMLLRRVSFILDIVYHIIISVFLFEFFSYLEIFPGDFSSYNLFLFFVNVLIMFTFFRIILLKAFSRLFKTEFIIAEYIHINFLVNKGVAIVLFPLVIIAYYLPYSVNEIVLFSGLTVIAFGLFLKVIRGYQIIIRKDVLIVYLILYLCTLEILPLLIGYKVFISLL
jgi:hypothetical protein